MNHVFRVNPNSIEDLKSVVNDFAHAMDPDLIKRVCSCARSKFEKIRTQRGGHFEQLQVNKSNLTIIMILMNE